MRRYLFAALLIFVGFSGTCFAAGYAEKSGATIIHQVPLYDPAYQPDDPNGYGRYPLSDVFTIITSGLIGADPEGTASGLLSAHLAASDPHPNYVLEAPEDGTQYLRVNGAWSALPTLGTVVNSVVCPFGEVVNGFNSATGLFNCVADQTGSAGSGIVSLNGSILTNQTFSAGSNINISTNAGTGQHVFSVTGLAPVATSGAYSSLTGTPTIPGTAEDVGAIPDPGCTEQQIALKLSGQWICSNLPSATWGNIIGTLSAQSDLNTALSSKIAIAHAHTGGTDGSQINHNSLGNAGVNSHATIDARLPTADQKAAMDGAASPSEANPFATIEDVQSSINGVSSFASRVGDVIPTTGDYTATQITNTPAGNIAATSVQGAVNELDSEKASVTHNHDATYAAIANGVTGGDSHDHSSGNGAQIDHANLANKGTRTHAEIDSHLAATANVHGVTGAVVGATQVQTLTNKTITTPTITLKQSTTAAPTSEGDIQWDTDDDRVKVGTGGGTRTLLDDRDVSPEQVYLTVRNETGSTITQGAAVYVSGYNTQPLVTLADNTSATASRVVGVVTADIANLANGKVMVSGSVTMDTSTYSAVGADLYLGTSGQIVEGKPGTGNYVFIGEVLIKATSGSVLLFRDAPNISGDDIVTGTIADARIASTIARDSELPVAGVDFNAYSANMDTDSTDDLTTANVGNDVGDVLAWQADGIPAGSINLPTLGSYLVNGNPLSDSFPVNTDDQAITEFTLTGTDLTITLESDAGGQKTVDLSGLGGGASSLAELTDWPAAVSATEVSYLDGTTSNLQAQLDALSSAFTALNNAFSAGNAPVLLSAVLGTDGTTLTLGFNETVNVGAGGSGGWNVDASTTGNDIAATYSSGDGTTSLAYTLASAVTTGETLDVDYTQPGNGIEDNDGTDLLSIVSAAVTNNSEYTGPTYLVEEDFEGTGAPASWTTKSSSGGGAVDYDSTSPVLSGSQAMKLWNTGAGYYSVKSPVFTGSSSGNYATCMFNHSLASASGNGYVIRFLDASNNALASVSFRYGTSYIAAVAEGGSIVAGSTALSESTNYYIKLRYVPGTGANAIASVWLSTDGTTWTLQGIASNGTGTANAAYISYENNMGGDMGFSIDQVRVSDADISY